MPFTAGMDTTTMATGCALSSPGVGGAPEAAVWAGPAVEAVEAEPLEADTAPHPDAPSIGWLCPVSLMRCRALLLTLTVTLCAVLILVMVYNWSKNNFLLTCAEYSYLYKKKQKKN